MGFGSVKVRCRAIQIVMALSAFLICSLSPAIAQDPMLVEGIDFLNERLPLPETERYNERDYIETGVRLSFGVDKSLKYYAGSYEEAAALFEESVRRFRYKSEVWVYLARSYWYMNSPDRARQTLELAQQVMPDLAERLWQPLIASLLDEIRQRANQQQVQVDFYSPGQEEFLSLFRLYLFLKDHGAATGVIRSAEARSLKMRGQATIASGSSRKSYVKEATKWLELADQLRSELSGLGVEVPQGSLLVTQSAQEAATTSSDEDAEKQRILQLKIEYYSATPEEFEELFDLYVRQSMNQRAAAVLTTLQREIGREQIRASVAPTVQDEAEVLQKAEELVELRRKLELRLGEDGGSQ